MAEGARLESVYTARYPGFESLSLRHSVCQMWGDGTGVFMKSLTLTAYSHLEMIEVEAPQPGEDEVVLRVATCGICGSDVHGYDGSSGRRIPPIVMGHEAAGTIHAVGRNVTRFREGDRVTLDSTVYCGACDFAGEAR